MRGRRGHGLPAGAARMPLTIRDVELDGRRGLDVRIADGRIAEIGPRLGRGGLEPIGDTRAG